MEISALRARPAASDVSSMIGADAFIKHSVCSCGRFSARILGALVFDRDTNYVSQSEQRPNTHKLTNNQ